MAYALRTSSGPVELPAGLPVSADGLQFSYATMMLWSDAERAAVGILPIAEPGPPPAGQIETGSTLDDNGTTISRVLTLAPIALPDAQAAQCAAVDAQVETILATGVLVSGQHVALDDSSRADLSGMAVTAIAAAAGTLPWPASYQTGWIAVENTRIPLPAAADGLQLAATAGDYYASVIQNGRNLKNAILAATTATAAAAVDITQGWPPNP